MVAVAYNPGMNDAFSAGVNHVRASGRTNDQSLTLGQDASMADQGLDQTSERWNAMSPRGIVSSLTAPALGLDSGYEGLARTEGVYQPGQMESLEDRLSDGSDSLD